MITIEQRQGLKAHLVALLATANTARDALQAEADKLARRIDNITENGTSDSGLRAWAADAGFFFGDEAQAPTAEDLNAQNVEMPIEEPLPPGVPSEIE